MYNHIEVKIVPFLELKLSDRILLSFEATVSENIFS